MMTITKFSLTTQAKEAVIDITHYIQEILKNSGMHQGICTIYVPHATAAITINENADPAIGDDFLQALNKLIPQGIWQHDRIDNNGASHIKAAIIGPSETIPFKEGKLLLGTWQSIMFIEFDGPRSERIVYVHLQEDA